jgi:hypothetical protein
LQGRVEDIDMQRYRSQMRLTYDGSLQNVISGDCVNQGDLGLFTVLSCCTVCYLPYGHQGSARHMQT